MDAPTYSLNQKLNINKKYLWQLSFPFICFHFGTFLSLFQQIFFCGLDMELFIDKQEWWTECGQSTKSLCLVLMLFMCGKKQYLCRECKFYGYILKLVANGKHYCNLGPLLLLKKKLYFMIVSFFFKFDLNL